MSVGSVSVGSVSVGSVSVVAEGLVSVGSVSVGSVSVGLVSVGSVSMCSVSMVAEGSVSMGSVSVGSVSMDSVSVVAEGSVSVGSVSVAPAAALGACPLSPPTAGARPCDAKDFGHGSVVCACNATYCDTLDPAALPAPGAYVKYESSKAGKRLERSEGSFQRDAGTPGTRRGGRTPACVLGNGACPDASRPPQISISP